MYRIADKFDGYHTYADTVEEGVRSLFGPGAQIRPHEHADTYRVYVPITRTHASLGTETSLEYLADVDVTRV